MRTITTKLLSAGLLLGVLACDGESTESADRADRADRATVERTVPPGPDGAPSSSTSTTAAPETHDDIDLDALLGGDPLSSESTEARRRDAEKVAACMRAQGFEYDPWIPELPDTPDADEAEADYRAFVEQYGYGITTNAGGGDPAEADPNRKRLEAMSPAERDAYTRALYGSSAQSTGTGAGPGPSGGGDDGGCIDPGAPAGADPEVAELRKNLNAVYERMLRDPRLVAAERAWIDCMAEAGFGGLDLSKGIGDAAYTLVAQTAREAGVDIDEEGHAGAADEATLQRMQEFERDVAGTDLRCRAEHVDAVRAALRVEYEQAFVTEHREQLERLRDRLASD